MVNLIGHYLNSSKSLYEFVVGQSLATFVGGGSCSRSRNTFVNPFRKIIGVKLRQLVSTQILVASVAFVFSQVFAEGAMKPPSQQLSMRVNLAVVARLPKNGIAALGFGLGGACRRFRGYDCLRCSWLFNACLIFYGVLHRSHSRLIDWELLGSFLGSLCEILLLLFFNVDVFFIACI
ncbi:hypothetical protein OH492_28010 [Vibrio chagasii]|nr:hypothetical protein [Vibrio chagasii]